MIAFQGQADKDKPSHGGEKAERSRNDFLLDASGMASYTAPQTLSLTGGSMARSPQDVTDAELAILQVLWAKGPATIRRLTDAIYPDGGTAYYATVQKLLERLKAKGCIRRERTSGAHVFSAAIRQEELIGRRLQAMAEKLCGGSLTPLLTHLVKAERLTARQRQELRALIDQLDQKTRARNSRR
jgi:predicted transcriptional regulator